MGGEKESAQLCFSALRPRRKHPSEQSPHRTSIPKEQEPYSPLNTWKN